MEGSISVPQAAGVRFSAVNSSRRPTESGRSATVAARILSGVSHRPTAAGRERQLSGIRTAIGRSDC
jgi:hypothetical protein